MLTALDQGLFLPSERKITFLATQLNVLGASLLNLLPQIGEMMLKAPEKDREQVDCRKLLRVRLDLRGYCTGKMMAFVLDMYLDRCPSDSERKAATGWHQKT